MTSLSVSIRPMTRASCETECDLDRGGHDRRVVGRHADVGGHDVDLVLGHDLGDVAQQAGPVVGLDPDRDRVGLGRRRLPLDVDEPADLALVEHGRARLEMDGHALAAGDEADDRVARDRVAALGEADEQVADALDPDAAGPLEPLRRRDRRERALDVVDDAEAHDHRSAALIAP